MNGTGADETYYCMLIVLIYIAYHAYRFYVAQIVSGFISFGSLHIKTKAFEPWQW